MIWGQDLSWPSLAWQGVAQLFSACHNSGPHLCDGSQFPKWGMLTVIFQEFGSGCGLPYLKIRESKISLGPFMWDPFWVFPFFTMSPIRFWRIIGPLVQGQRKHPKILPHKLFWSTVPKRICPHTCGGLLFFVRIFHDALLSPETGHDGGWPSLGKIWMDSTSVFIQWSGSCLGYWDPVFQSQISNTCMELETLHGSRLDIGPEDMTYRNPQIHI